jgi:hypothetical protein
MRTIEMTWSVDGGRLVCRWAAWPERADGSSGSISSDRFGVAGQRSRQPSGVGLTESSESNWRAVFGFGRTAA